MADGSYTPQPDSPLLARDWQAPSCKDAYKLSSFTRVKPMQAVLRERTHEQVQEEEEGEDPQLHKVLTIKDLLGYGVGCTVGAGIYSLISKGLKQAGPALVLSFLVGGISCVFTGLAYSEFAARVPVSGSAYTYAYTSFGEFIAWIIGWNLTLEYAISAAATARGWAAYVVTFLETFGVTPPAFLIAEQMEITTDISCSILAAVIVMVCTFVMIFGVKESSRFNNIVTVANVLVLLFVIILGATKLDTANWTAVNDSFVPYGFNSVMKGAGTVFFSYLGFDMVSSLAEEVKRPQRDMPIGIIGSLGISSALYVAVTLVVAGMVGFPLLVNSSAPLPVAFKAVGYNWANYIISTGSLFGLTTATFTCLLGQPRIFFRMAADVSIPRTVSPVILCFVTPLIVHFACLFRMLPGCMVHAGAFLPRIQEIVVSECAIGRNTDNWHSYCLHCFLRQFGGPCGCHFSGNTGGILLGRCWHCGHSLSFPSTAAAGIDFNGFVHAACIPRIFVEQSGKFALRLSNTHLVFTAFHFPWSLLPQDAPLWLVIILAVLALVPLVAIAFQPQYNIPTSFKCPLLPWIPAAGIAVNCSMLANLGADAWIRLAGWTVVGMAIYLAYGIRKSRLNPIQGGFKVVTDTAIVLPGGTNSSIESDTELGVDSDGGSPGWDEERPADEPIRPKQRPRPRIDSEHGSPN